MPTALVIVLDAVGIDTLNYLLDKHPGPVNLPNMVSLGLGALLAERHRERLGQTAFVAGFSAKLMQASATADSLVGHREMVGVVDARTWKLFPDGLPPAYVAALEARIGRKTTFNRMAGGDDAIALNWEEHVRTGSPISYASMCDPLFQFAMDESVISVVEQHRIAETAFALAREMGVPITRVIARPYVRTPDGEVTRTANRRDIVLPLSGSTLVDILHQQGVYKVAVGKTADLVEAPYDDVIHLTRRDQLDSALGLRFVHPKEKDTNPFNIQGIVTALAKTGRSSHRPKGTFVWANLVDTDALWGHTQNVAGTLRALEEFDRCLAFVERQLRPGDLLLITADHGMRHAGNYGYHNKEPLPLLGWRVPGASGQVELELGTGQGLTEVGMLVAQFFGCAEQFKKGISYIPADAA